MESEEIMARAKSEDVAFIKLMFVDARGCPQIG